MHTPDRSGACARTRTRPQSQSQRRRPHSSASRRVSPPLSRLVPAGGPSARRLLWHWFLVSDRGPPATCATSVTRGGPSRVHRLTRPPTAVTSCPGAPAAQTEAHVCPQASPARAPPNRERKPLTPAPPPSSCLPSRPRSLTRLVPPASPHLALYRSHRARPAPDDEDALPQRRRPPQL